MRYKTYGEFLKKHFGERVYKLPLDGGFTCPNIDGKLAKGGCIYCSDGSRTHGVDPSKSIRDQVKSNIEFYSKRHKINKFIAYFQAYTNTYAPTDILKQKYDEALELPEVVGLAVSTRPDCLSNDTIDLLKSYSKDRYVQLEIGLQTVHDETLAKLNRWHTYHQFELCMEKLANSNLDIVVHIILGLPGESEEMMHETIKKSISFPIVNGLKIQNLYVIKGTELGNMFENGKVKIIEEEPYIQLVCDLLEKIPPHIIIHRLFGETHPKELLAPRWIIGAKDRLLKKVDTELEKRGSFQGAKFF